MAAQPTPGHLPVEERNWRGGRQRTNPLCLHCAEPGRYPWHGTGTRASPGAISFPIAPGQSCPACWRRRGRDGLIGHTIFWARLSGPGARDLLQHQLAIGLDQHDPAAASGLAWKIAIWILALGPAIGRHHQRVELERDLDGDGLL